MRVKISKSSFISREWAREQGTVEEVGGGNMILNDAIA